LIRTGIVEEKLNEERNLKIPKEMLAKNFSYIFLLQLRGYVNSSNTDVFFLEIA
jgi:hypothetical protein